MRDKLETARVVSTRVTEGLHLLGILGEALSRAAPPHEQGLPQGESLRAEYSRLRNNYDDLTIAINTALTKLKVTIERSTSFVFSTTSVSENLQISISRKKSLEVC